jgi:hypothetical protein
MRLSENPNSWTRYPASLQKMVLQIKWSVVSKVEIYLFKHCLIG